MNRPVLLAALAAALAAAGAGPVSAELVLDAAGWQSGKPQRPPRPVLYADAASVALPAKGAPRLRAKARLKNRGPNPVEGVLLRYAVTARLLSSAAAGEGSWAVPFLIEERRVPKIGANQVLEVPLVVSPQMEQYLRRLARQGLRADRLRVQVMIEPHAGQEVRVLETELELTK